MTTYEEWRVTGRLADDDEPYEFTWSPVRGQGFDDPEGDARHFIEITCARLGWIDGLHLHKRTVTATGWEAVE